MPGVRVGVLEAGRHFTDDPMLDELRTSRSTLPANLRLIFEGNIGITVGNVKYDWNDETEPIPSLGGRVIGAPHGRMLGGSTGINHTAWDRGSRADYDAWTHFGGADWSFDGLLPSFKKAEDARSVHENPNLVLTMSTDIVGGGFEESTGTTGPVKISYNETETDVSGVFVRTWNGMGVPTSANPVSEAFCIPLISRSTRGGSVWRGETRRRQHHSCDRY